MGKKQKLEPKKLMSMVEDFKEANGETKAKPSSPHLKKNKKRSNPSKKHAPTEDKNLSREDNLLNKMVKELEHLNPKGEKKPKTSELLQKNKVHEESKPIFSPHILKHEQLFHTTKKSNDQLKPKTKSLSLAKRNDIQHVEISATDDFADLDLESGSGSGAPFIIDTPKKVKKIIPIQKVQPSKGTPKPNPNPKK